MPFGVDSTSVRARQSRLDRTRMHALTSLFDESANFGLAALYNYRLSVQNWCVDMARKVVQLLS